MGYPDIHEAAHIAKASNVANLVIWSTSGAATFIELDKQYLCHSRLADIHRRGLWVLC